MLSTIAGLKMSDHLAFNELAAEPVQRRCWLLYRALDCLPLDQAIDWARRADDFIMYGRTEPLSEPAGVTALHRSEQPIEVPAAIVADEVVPAALPLRSAMSPDERRRLIDRLAAGAKNVDLATEFGLTPKQVQGFRIGCAREIAARRLEPAHPEAEIPPAPPPASAIAASVDEVVRFLRQQDDVVVPQGDGEFLVNARFRLPLDELVSRANRIRKRQGKLEFALANGVTAHTASRSVATSNGHAHA
jgi:hypothetical protein